jgi:hypothetical protein
MAAFDGTFIAPWGANTNPQYATSVATELAKAPGQFGQNLANMYGSYNQGYGTYNQALQGLGDSYAKNYAAMASGIGNVANALGNTWNNAQANSASASAAESARQAAVSNLGTAAMTSYGNVAGQGLQAWAQNQNGYQKSLSDMAGANQAAVSSLGSSRYNALANLGKSGAAMQVGRDVSAAIPGMGAIGNTFSAPNYREPTGSSGGYGGGSSGGAGYDMLSGLRGDINDGRELDALSRGYGSSMGSLNSDQALARNMPRTMVNDARTSLMDFNRMNLDASSQGMNQFYSAYRDNMGDPNRPGQAIPTGSLLDALAGGYSDSANRIGTAQKDVNTGFSDNKGIYNQSVAGVNDLYNRSIGNTGVFNNALQNQQMDYALKDAAAARKKREQEQTRASILAKFGSPAAYARALNGYNY